MTQWRIQDFPEGAPIPKGSAHLLFCKVFSENCMKMKKNWTNRGRASLVPPISATVNA